MTTPTATKHYADAAGRYLGGFAGVRLADGREQRPAVPAGAVEVPEPPEDGRQVWDAVARAWGPKPPPPTPAERAAAELAGGVLMRALVAELAARFSVTPAALVASIRARATE